MNPDLLQLQPTWLDAQRPREGRYVLGPLLGKGGMGEVVEAWDVVLCRTVALKILRNMEPTSLIRFMHEAQIQARVAHPHICRIYDVDSSEGTVKIAMQLVRGPNLETASRDLNLETIVSILAQVTEAVHAAHSLKLIHRDLKPSNILLERAANGRWIPYICDFGLAMALDEPALTYSHGVIGTPAYMAPEQFHGERSRIGPATDVYGLGGTLHFALLGRAPSGPTHGQPLPFANLAPEPAPAPPRRNDLPRDLWLIIHKCLEADPALRYPSAAALAEDLWRFLNGEPVQATSTGSLRRLWRRSQRLVRVSLGTGLVAISLAGAWVLEGAYLRQRQETSLATVHLFGLEAADMERELRQERMLPPHDLRPALGRAQALLKVIQERAAAQGAEARGPGQWATAKLYLAMGDYAKAQSAAELAWDSGFQSPEAAEVLARAITLASLESDATQVAAGPGSQASHGSLADRVEGLFRQARQLHPGPNEFAQAAVAFLRRDFTAAAATAHGLNQRRRWDDDPACLEVASLCALGSQRQEAGALADAERLYQDAVMAARGYLAVAPSSETGAHAYLRAARSLAACRWERDSLGPEQLRDLQLTCDQAMRLNPEDPETQEDWLGLCFLRTSLDLEQGRNPDQLLNGALVFLGTQIKGSPSPPLRTARMLIYWRLAERQAELREDPGPALAEALKDPVPPGSVERKFLGQVLTTKARLEAARGIDPRATVSETLARIQPPPGAQPSWNDLETAAEAWLIRAEWEAPRDPAASASLAQAKAMADGALRLNPGSASAQALAGLIQVLELRLTPAAAAPLRLQAQEHLRAALALKRRGRLQAQLEAALKRIDRTPG